MNNVVVGVFGETEIAADGLDVVIGFGAKHSTDVGNFIVNSFEWNVGCHDTWDVVLDGSAQYATEDGENKQPH